MQFVSAVVFVDVYRCKKKLLQEVSKYSRNPSHPCTFTSPCVKWCESLSIILFILFERLISLSWVCFGFERGFVKLFTYSECSYRPSNSTNLQEVSHFGEPKPIFPSYIAYIAI